MVDIAKSQKVYEKVKTGLKGKEGMMILIEPDSGDYFIGKTAGEAYELAIKKHPNKQFYFHRIGAKAAFFIGTGMSRIMERL